MQKTKKANGMASQRLIWLDCLRLIAGISMLGLHSTADPNGQAWVAYAADERVAPLLLRALVYVARTELFLIISIFLLLMALERRPRGYRATMAEQSRRLLVPFLFWTLFYAGYGLIKADAFGYLPQALAELSDPQAWVSYLLLGKVKYHMHFLPTLFGLLLLYPLFRLAVRFPALGMAVIACLMIRRELDGFVYATFWGTEALPYLVRGIKILTYVGYGMMAGAALGIWQRLSGPERGVWFAPIAYLGGMLFLIKLVATWKTVETGQWQFGYVPAYWADFLMPVVLFSGCMALGHKSWPLVISRLAPFSFGIYLCHPIFLDLCEIALRDTALPPIAQVGIKITLTLSATCLLVWILSRLRLLAWTIGLGPLPFSMPFRSRREEASQC
jgi:surface polysaccharide O-acyltransferase-like enzyme